MNEAILSLYEVALIPFSSSNQWVWFLFMKYT
jgi:hypothetical protein